MRWVATGLLIVMAILYWVSRSLEEFAIGWSWVRAFAEAGLVGALADWFAVTALFRHPLGLPIPHTAIIVKQKSRLGVALARFFRGSFLSREEVGRQWREWRPVERFLRWLVKGEHADETVRRVSGWLPTLLEDSDGGEMAKAGAARLKEGLRQLPVGRVVSVLLEGFLESPSRRVVMAPILARLGKAVTENRDWVMEEARKGAPMRKARILGAVTEVAAMVVSGKAAERFSKELKTASEDHEHVLYSKIEEALGETVVELEQEETAAEWESFKQRVLDDPNAERLMEEALRSGGKYVLAGARDLKAGEGETRWGDMVRRAAERLLENKEQLANLESRVESAVAGFFDRYGEGVEEIIEKAVAGWKAEDLVERIENRVGPDLQFIRINGTIIGGTVGVILHAIEVAIWGH